MIRATILVLAICTLTSANAATFTVTNLSDSGPGSLRQAILDANAAAGSDVIEFSIFGTISLTSGQLTITDDLTINGPGSGNLNVFGIPDPYRVFEISSPAVVEINDLTISGGGDGINFGTGIQGAGILNSGMLTLNSSILRGEHGQADGNGGGILNFGTLTLNNTELTGYHAMIAGGIGNYGGGTAVINDSIVSGTASDDAGGIDNNGTMTITNSRISNEGAGEGTGAINNFGTMLLLNSTISGSAVVAAGGIGNGGTLTIVNSTISDSRAGTCGGICNDGSGVLTLVNSTVTGNQSCGGASGIDNRSQATVTISNTIVAGNTYDEEDCDSNDGDVSGAFTSLGHNLIGISDSSTGFGAAGDQLGTIATPLDPLLGPLQDNGGPTETHALLAGSPAIDAGSNALVPFGVLTDQRGFLRIVNGIVDIGSVEFGDVPPLSIDIKPGSTNNPVNPSSGGVIPVAILTTDIFDALTVDYETVTFGPDGATEVHGSAHVQDVDDDGDVDLLLHFKVRDSGIACGDTEATLVGDTYDFVKVFGSDAIVTVKCR